jgi:cytochrome oxidase Cu insertion factor (SCO1/SenC/PrrC family)
MQAKPRLVGAIVAAVAVIAVTVVVVLFVTGGEDDTASYRGSPPPPGIMLGHFELLDYTGVRVSREDLKGKVVLLTFLESKCKEACPIIASQVARTIERLPPEERRQVVAVAISTHPTDDNPASVRAFLRAQRAEGKIHYLVGSEQELRPVWQRFGVLSALDSGDADTHSASVHLYDRSGEWVASLHPGIDLTTANLLHDVGLALQN